MRYAKFIIALFVSIVLLAGCKVDATTALESQGELTLQIYGTGKPLVKKKIAPDSEMYKELHRWVSENTTGWSHTPASYVPSYLVQGKTLSLNFQGTRVILNFEDGQYVKDVDPSEYDFLK